MTAPVQHRSHLVMPLRRLTPPPPREVPRLLHLGNLRDAGLATWAAQVRATSEACLLIDDQGRVAAMSLACGLLLATDPVRTVGALLVDVVDLVDFSANAAPLPDPERQTPPLRALSSGNLARGLVRVRRAGGALSTYDVVGVPLSGGAGALAFLLEV